jgi:UDP-N-acetylmuramoyl-tripeptide--D-alanyl-D-alanine ligase
VSVLTFDFACRHAGGTLVGISGKQPLPPISIDTRTLEKDEIFWTLKGRKDGQEFIADAFRRGASAMVVSESWWKENAAKEIPAVWVVPDRLRALQALARAWRSELSIPVIGITGSNGKTSTKELARCALETQFSVGATAGNRNNHIGVPLTLLSLREHHDIAVVEMGANHLGEIKLLCDIAQPTDGLITSIGRAHLEGFVSIEQVAHAKGELFDFLGKAGRAFVSIDDSRCIHLSEGLDKRVGFGFQPRPSNWEDAYCEGQELHLTESAQAAFRFGETNVQLRVSGRLWARSALAALTIAVTFGIPLARAAEAVSSWQGIAGRTQIRRLQNMTLIDDTYNANPDSMRAALELLCDLSSRRRIAVLGDMGELGSHAEEEHRRLGREIAKMKINKLYCLGPYSNWLAEEASNAGADAWHTEKPEALVDKLRRDLIRGDTVLFKASRSVALDEIMNAVVA